MSEQNQRPTQVKRLLAYLQVHGSITNYEALKELGIFSPAKRICDLKKQKYEIHTEWEEMKNRYGEKCRVKRYYLLFRDDIGVNQ